MYGGFFFIVFFAEIAGTITGFGSSTILLPAALLFFDFPTALVLVAFAHVSGNIGRLSFFRHGLDLRTLFLFGIPSVVCALIGAYWAANSSQELLKIGLGIFLIIYVILSLSGKLSVIKLSSTRIIAGGGISGLLAGLIGTGGALRGAFLMAFGLPKERYIATAAAIALAVDITRIPIYLQQGFLPRALIWYIPIIFLVSIVGSFIGRQFVSRIPQERFRRVVLAALFLIGLYFVKDAVDLL